MWNGFWAHCIHILVDDGVFEEAIELAEARLSGKSEKELAVIEQLQEIKFEKSLASRLMAIPYMVWKRKGKVKYYKFAPKNMKECPFGFEPLHCDFR
jgi:hypothetical protein